MKELCAILDEMLPPGVNPPSQADMQSVFGGSPGRPHIMSSPRGPGVQPDAGLSRQDQLNQLNLGRSKQPGSYPHGIHGQGMFQQ